MNEFEPRVVEKQRVRSYIHETANQDGTPCKAEVVECHYKGKSEMIVYSIDGVPRDVPEWFTDNFEVAPPNTESDAPQREKNNLDDDTGSTDTVRIKHKKTLIKPQELPQDYLYGEYKEDDDNDSDTEEVKVRSKRLIKIGAKVGGVALGFGIAIGAAGYGTEKYIVSEVTEGERQVEVGQYLQDIFNGFIENEEQ